MSFWKTKSPSPAEASPSALLSRGVPGEGVTLDVRNEDFVTVRGVGFQPTLNQIRGQDAHATNSKAFAQFERPRGTGYQPVIQIENHGLVARATTSFGFRVYFLFLIPLLALYALPAFAQESPTTKDTNQTVYVSDSTTAVERMALAERMERLKEWAKAAELYQEVLEKYADRVVPANGGAPGHATQYTTVVTAVQDRLGKWPNEGLVLYRSRYEGMAKNLLESANDEPAALARVVSLYFATDAGKTAALRMMDLQMETGEFSAVAYLGQRLLESHPNLMAERAAVMYRTALALHLSGNEKKSQAMAQSLQKDFPDALGTIAGKDTKLAAAIIADLKEPMPQMAQASDESWLTFGGSADRDHVSSATGKPGARVARIAYSAPPRGSVNEGNLQQSRKELQADRDNGRMTGIMPVVDHGEMFFNDGAKIYGVSLESGFPLAGWAKTYPDSGQYSASTWPTPRDQQLTITATPTMVLAVMGLGDRTAVSNGQPQATSAAKLVCLDRSTGALRWICNPRDFDDHFANLRTVELSGCPVVVGDTVYIAARGSKGNQFEDAYVLCLDAATGKLRWSTYVASASNAVMAWMDPSLAPDENAIHVSYSGGRVYTCTNLGAVACIDAFSGSILWLDLYPRDPQRDPAANLLRIQSGRREDLGSSSRPWAFNAPVIDNGKLFILPTDSKTLLVYDAGSGEEIKRIDLNDLVNGEEAPPDTLLSVHNERVLVSGVTRVFCLNWQAYDHASFDLKNLDNAALVWPRQIACPIKGRGFVTADALYLPTDDRLLTINISNGKITDAMPAFGRSWESGQGRGNVIVSDGHVVIAGPAELEVRTDLALARAKLDEQVASKPQDPGPRLTYAETMFNAGQWDLSLAQLDEASRLLGGTELRAGPDRDRLFNLCLTCARAMLVEKNEDSLALAGKMFDRAAPAAGTPAQQVHYRLQRAKLAHLRKDAPGQVKLLQEILQNEAMRSISVTDENSGGSMAAAVVAEHDIALLIKEFGNDCYATYEAAARQALSSAGPEPAVLLNIAATYPNSTAAPQALLAAANFNESSGDYRSATQILRQLAFKYPDTADRARVLEDLARNYLALPDRGEVALSRLMYGAKLFENKKLAHPLKLPNGKVLENVTFAQAASAVREILTANQSAALPDFHLPRPEPRHRNPEPFVPENPGSVIANVAAIVPTSSYKALLTFTPGNGLSCFAIGASRPTWTCSGIKDLPRGATWIGGDLLAWTADSVVMISGDKKGEIAWRAAMKSIAQPDITPVEDNGPANPEADANPGVIVMPAQARAQQQMLLLRRQVNVARFAQMQVRLMGQARPAGGDEQITFVKSVPDRILIATTGGRIIALAPSDGRVAWQARLSAQPIDCFVANDDFVAARCADESGIIISAFDVTTGQSLFRKSYSPDAHAPTNLAMAADGTLVFTTYDRLCGKDLYDPSPNLVFETAPVAENPTVFLGSSQPDQLLIQGSRILAIGDNGAFVHVYSLFDGKVVRYKSADGGEEVDALLKTGVNDGNVHLRVAGPHLYVYSPRSLYAYNLDHPDQSWFPPLNAQISLMEPFVGQDYLLMTSNSEGRLALQAFSRDKSKDDRESGLWVFSKTLAHPNGVKTITPVEGGVYYLANDNTLHFLAGARGSGN